MVKLLLVFTCLYVVSSFEINLGGFDSFCEKHGKQYASQERMKKFETWSKNMADIKELQERLRKEGKHYSVGENMFTDMTDEEKLHYVTGRDFMESPEFREFNDSLREPRGITEWQKPAVHFDWRNSSLNVVAPVKSQGATCGSCWAFAVIATIETQYAVLHNGDLHQLSEQQLVDCDSGSKGCVNGHPTSALSLSINKGNALNSAYPYTGVTGSCRRSVETLKLVESYKRLNTVRVIETFVQNAGPAVFYMDVAKSFLSYKSGIYDPEDWECDQKHSSNAHAMAFVGYGTENGVDYWIARNSYGSNWGENGYIRMAKGVNKCRIETFVDGPWLYGQRLHI